MTRPPVRSALALLALALCSAPAVVLAAGPAGAVDTSTCHGKATTMVVEGSTGDVNGTAGDDVVVVVGSTFAYGSFVHTLGGNDSICLVGTENGVTLDAGAGDDYVTTVDATAAGPNSDYLAIEVSLGPGADTFLGGPTKDVVSTGPVADSQDDVVDLGPGEDTMVDGASLPTTAVVGGPGVDRLVVPPSSTPVVSDVTHTVVAAGVTRPFAPDFEVFAFTGAGLATFHGGAAAERVVARDAGTEQSLVADMGDNADVIDVDQTVTGTWDGGTGTDQLVTTRDGRLKGRKGTPDVAIDLLRGDYRVVGQSASPLSGFESVDVEHHRSVQVTGSAQGDLVHVAGCRATVDAGGGADVVDFDTYGSCAKTPVQLTAFGGPGGDLVTGGRGHDVLHGGSGNDHLEGRGGRDTTYGDAGRDQCSAERRVSC